MSDYHINILSLTVESSFLITAQVRLAIVDGKADIEPTLNGLCPHIKPDSVEQYLRRYWQGVELPEPAWGEDYIVAV